MEVEYQPATIETLLLSDTLLTSSSAPGPDVPSSPEAAVSPTSAVSMVFPHPPSLSPRAIAQSTVSELSQLEWEGGLYCGPEYSVPEYTSYQDLEWSRAPAASPSTARDILTSALVLNDIEIEHMNFSRDDFKEEKLDMER